MREKKTSILIETKDQRKEEREKRGRNKRIGGRGINLTREIKKYHSSRRIVFFDGRNLGPQNIKYGTCQFGSFLRRATSPLSLPALPYPAPIFSARASSATVADALISLSNVTSRPRHAFDTWYFLRGVVWSHDKAGPVQFVHNGEIQHMAQGAPILGLK